MTRRVISQIVVFILLCTPLLSLVGFLVYTVIPHTALIVVHPVSCAVFLACGLYGASLLRERGWWASVWYFISTLLMLLVGAVGIGAYLLGFSTPFVLHGVQLAVGTTLLFVMQAWVFVLLPYKTRWIRFLQGAVVLLGLYLYLAPLIGTSVGLWYVPLPFSSLVLFVCLATLVALGESSHTEKSPVPVFVLVTSIVIIGAISTTAVWRIVSLRADIRQTTQFAQEVTRETYQAQQVVNRYAQLAQELQSTTQNQQPLSEAAWQQIVRSIDTGTYPAIASISYIPKVVDTATTQDRFPIQYASSFREGVQSTTGFDVASDPLRNTVLRSALATRTIAATPVMEDTNMFSLYIPLYREGEPAGIVALSFNTTLFVGELTNAFSQQRSARIAISDTVRVLYQEQSPESVRARQGALLLGSSVWNLSFTEGRTPESIDASIVLRAGSIATALLALIVGLVVGRTRRRTKARKGVFVIHPRAVSLLPTLESLVREYESLYKQKKQRFEAAIPKRIPVTLVDPTVVRVVLETILRNAYQLAPFKGSIRFAAEVTTIKRTPYALTISCISEGEYDIEVIQHELDKKTSAHLSRLGIETLYRAKRMTTLLGCTLSTAVHEQEMVVTLTIPMILSEEPKAL